MNLKSYFVFFIISSIVLYACSNSSAKTNLRLPVINDKSNGANTVQSECDPDLWKYVYDASRLQVLDKCKTVTGIIEETSADEDGDQHMLLKLDKGQKQLLTKKNKSKKQGNLVIEAVCINNITRKKAMGACTGYVNHVQLPRVGDHVKVTGSYVIDSHNGWSEIHPISKIDLIK